VCRTPRKLFALQGGDSQPKKTFSISDAEMFGTINVSGTGNMTLEEFAGYFWRDV
jgi:hypothetical protein